MLSRFQKHDVKCPSKAWRLWALSLPSSSLHTTNRVNTKPAGSNTAPTLGRRQRKHVHARTQVTASFSTAISRRAFKQPSTLHSLWLTYYNSFHWAFSFQFLYFEISKDALQVKRRPHLRFQRHKETLSLACYQPTHLQACVLTF